ncbi:hypothetical protein BZA70DRAFT_246995 [Myxozyma melibiosi]|uniref:K Homology domain-containing protein n=1 Tax=Myxozyma melibiosi TaxID=54550 RepID=A0ABR1F747_9ASCO
MTEDRPATPTTASATLTPSQSPDSAARRASSPASSPSLASYDTMTATFAVPYRAFTAPADSIFSSANACVRWNDPLISTQQQQQRSFDNLAGIRKVVAEINDDLTLSVSASVTVEKRLAKSAIVSLSGTSAAVLTSRARILRAYYDIGVKHIGIDTFQLLDKDGKLQTAVADQLNQIAQYTTTSIFVVTALDQSLRPQNPSPQDAQDIWKPYHILAYGDLESVAYAKTRLSLLIDDLNRLFIDRLSIPLSLHSLLAGRDCENFNKIEAETNTKIYAPTLFPGVHAAMDKSYPRRDYDELYISGQEADVGRAIDFLNDFILRIPAYSKEFLIPVSKIDYLLLHWLDRLEEILRKNAAFIQFPCLGAAKSLVRVQCSSHIFVENTIRLVAKLTTEIYNAGYWIHEGRADENGMLNQPRSLPPAAAINEALERVSASSMVDITFLRGTFEVSGDAEATKAAVSQIRGLPFWPQDEHQVRFRLELSVDQREFIAGKKNGKINRIMSTSHVWIRFVPFTEYNFYVELAAADYTAALYGIQLLEEELPAEISFYVPEMYHRSIIGPSGQQIQQLMRKYNVFVKFSNAYEQAPSLGSDQSSQPSDASSSSSSSKIDNVVVRCPSKNKDNLEPAKEEIFEILSFLKKGGLPAGVSATGGNGAAVNGSGGGGGGAGGAAGRAHHPHHAHGSQAGYLVRR